MAILGSNCRRPESSGWLRGQALRFATVVLGGCSTADEPTPYAWELPSGLEAPPEPERNRTTREKVALGERLFSDQRLSANGRYACSNCHEPSAAFSDPATPSIGLYGEPLPRQAPSLANVGYLGVYTWANPKLLSLEGQALVPLLAKRPAELDLADRVDAVVGDLRSDAELYDAFWQAFPREGELVTLVQITDALAAYQRTLVSVQSPYDQFLAGDGAALSSEAQRGRDLFFSDRLACGECHRGRWLSDATDGVDPIEEAFHNTGLYNLGGAGRYPRESPGLVEFTGSVEDTGKFRTPPLRNLTLTAPFMHDGSVPTLDDVIDHYGAGGRTIEAEPFAGVGSANPYKDRRITGFRLSDEERASLLAFLESLTDPRFVESSSAGRADQRGDLR